MKEKSPALQWYVKQYLGDAEVLAMDWDARGMHVHLLNLAWQEVPVGSIPNDMGILRRWLGLPSGFADADRVWARVWPQISAAWALKDGRWFNSGLVRAFERQQIYKQNGSKKPAKQEQIAEVEDEVVDVTGVFLLPDQVPAKTWEEFLEMRRKKRASPTEHAKALLVKKLLKLQAEGHDPGEVLEQSIRSNWTDVFPLRQEQANGKGTSKAERRNAHISETTDRVFGRSGETSKDIPKSLSARSSG